MATNNPDILLVVGADTGLSYEQLLKDINGIVNKLNENPVRIKVAFDANSAQIQKDIAKATSEMTKQMQEATNPKSVAESDVKQIAQKNQLTKQYITLLNQMVTAEKKWTAARSGHESSSYKGIEKSVLELQNAAGDFDKEKLSVDAFHQKLSETQISFASYSKNIKGAGENTKSFGDNVSSLLNKFKSLITFTAVFTAVVRSIREMISISIELDSAMTQLKIVTNETAASYEKFGDKIADIAQNIGSNIADLLESSTTYARLGYSLDASSVLAKYTAMLQNVGK